MMNTIKVTPKDFFLYIAATASLYAVIIAIINLVFSIVNYSFPDALAYSYTARTMAWPMSMVIVLVPLYYTLEWLISRDIRNFPEKITLWIRRWRIYLTLFLTGATIIGDLISLINIYLAGEISVRFIWKIVAVFIISGIVFVYYLLDKQNPDDRSLSIRRSLAWFGIIVTLAAVVGGFVIVGSPNKQRNLKFDESKVRDLSSIQYQIINYWQSKGSLPSNLSDLKDSLSYSNIPTDPQSKASYGYNKTASTSFELCAKFNLKTEDTEGRGSNYRGGTSYYSYDTSYGGQQNNWQHPEGNYCFERKIDVDIYPVNKRPAIEK